jgi:oxygen-independent coproporphyrinogen-3 oxidase
VIQRLMCDFTLDVPAFESEHGVVFADYFANEMPRLREFAEDGLLELGARTVAVTARGRLLIRNVAMAFDKYLGTPNLVPLQRMPYSRTI